MSPASRGSFAWNIRGNWFGRLEVDNSALKVSKKAILLQLASLLEPKDEVLRTIDSTFKSDLFYAFNNLNLRHNNIDPTKVQKYKKKIAEMPSEELEKWYDEVYQMCLLAFLRIEHVHRKKDFDELKTQIEAQ